MLKVHPEFRIYGLGFADTLKDLVNEGFLENCEVPDVTFTREFKVSETAEDESLYESDGPAGSPNETFRTLYRSCERHACRFVVSVCDEIRPGTSDCRQELIGFIYL